MLEGRDVSQLFDDGAVVDEALRLAALAARREYAQARLAMPAWSDGRVVWVPPESLDGDEPGPQPC
jgi:hypothetical protein